MLKILLFILIFSYTSVYSIGDFIDSEDLKSLDESVVANNYNNYYIYRLENSSKFYYYRFNLNSIVYESKLFFSIPTKFKNVIHKSIFYINGEKIREVIFNHNFLLVDGDVSSIEIEYNGEKQKLEKSEIPKSILINSRIEASVNIIKKGKLEKIGMLPYIISDEELFDKHLIFIPKGTDYIFKEYFVEGEKTIKYEKVLIELSHSPILKFAKKDFKLDIKSGTDKDKLRYLDSISVEIKKEQKNNEQMRDDYFKILRNKLYMYHEKLSNETNEEYEENKKVFESIIESTAEDILLKSGFTLIQSSYDQKQELIESYKDDLDKRLSENMHILNKVFFVELNGNIGKNLPYAATDPGPSKLIGLGGGIQFYFPLSERLNGFVRTGYNYSQWYFNEKFLEYSTSQSIGLDLGVSFPFKPPINIKNLVRYVDLNPFIRVGYNNLNVVNDEPHSDGIISVGGGLGLDIRMTSLPVIMGGNYCYNSSKYGDMVLLIKLPFFWMSK